VTPDEEIVYYLAKVTAVVGFCCCTFTFKLMLTLRFVAFC